MVCLSMCQFYISNSGLELFSLIGCVEPFSLKPLVLLLFFFFFHSASACTCRARGIFFQRCYAIYHSTRLEKYFNDSGNVHFSLPTFLRSQFSSRSLSGHVVYAACVPRSHPLISFKLTSRSKKIGHPTSQLCFSPFSSFKRCAQSQRMSHLFPSEFLTQILVRICCLVYT